MQATVILRGPVSESERGKRMGRRRLVAAAASVVMAGCGSALHGATDTYVGPAGGDWNTASYWMLPGVPAAGDWALFQPSGVGSYTYDGNYSTGSPLGSLTLGNGGNSAPTLNQSGSTLSVGTETILSGKFSQTGGVDNVAGNLYVTDAGSTIGTYSMGGGSLAANETFVGDGGGFGTFLQSAGSSSLATLGNQFIMGDGTGSTGVGSISGGSLTAIETFVGYSGGVGTFLQNGGSTSLGVAFIVGDGTGSTGTGSLSGGSLAASSTYVGDIGGNGTLSQSTGSASYGTNFEIGEGTSSTGTLSLTGGSLIGGTTLVGDSGGAGTFVQSAGSSDFNGGLNIGEKSTSKGYGSFSGGTLTAAATAVGLNGGNGTFLQSGTLTVSSLGQLEVGLGTGAIGVASLSGGSMTTGSNVYVGATGGVGTFLQGGGSSSLGTFLYLGDGAGAAGTISLTGGSLSAVLVYPGYLGGSGTYLQNAGSASVEVLEAGIGTGSKGTCSLSGGSLTISTAYVGISGGAGTFLQSAGSSSVSNGLYFGEGTGSTGVGSLSGGTLTAANTYVGDQGGVGTFLQSGSLTVSNLGVVSVSSTGTIALSGGTLNVATIAGSGSVTVSGGRLAITNAGSLGTGSLTSIHISGTGVFDVGSSGMVIQYSGPSPIGELTPNGHTQTYPAGSIQGYIQSAYDGGSWDKPGLSSSAAEKDPFGLTAVGALDQHDLSNLEGQDYTGTTWMGLSITSDDSVLVRYTYYGDTDLDGTVGSADVNNLELGYSGFGDGWVYGDFNYDGVVDAADVNLLDLNYGNVPLGDVNALTSAQVAWLLATEKGLTPQQIAAFEARVELAAPEPVGMGLFGAGAIGLLGRRRRAASKLAG